MKQLELIAELVEKMNIPELPESCGALAAPLMALADEWQKITVAGYEAAMKRPEIGE